MGFFKSIFLVNGDKDKKQESNPVNGNITSKGLLKKLSDVFVDYIDKESVGQRMIYPMAFNVLMHRTDYNSRKETLHLVLPEVVGNFYHIIKQKSREYPNYKPAAMYWFFQFSPTLVDSLPLDNGDVLEIKPGNPAIAASLMFQDDSNGGSDNVSVENNVSVSVSCLNSNVFATANINIETLVGVDMVSEGVFRFKFDNKLIDDATKITKVPPADNAVSGFATLKYQKDGKTYCYTMRDVQILISGSSELNEKRSIFKVKSDRVAPGHVVVRYLAPENKFQIAANGPVRLNGNSMRVATSGDLEWRDLANRSRIFINDALTIHFEKLI